MVEVIPNISFKAMFVSNWAVIWLTTVAIFDIVKVIVSMNITTALQTAQEISIGAQIPVICSIISKGTWSMIALLSGLKTFRDCVD
jgi:hypothetical protein